VTIAVAFALNAEFAPWRARHGFTDVSQGGGMPRLYEAAGEAVRLRAAVVGIRAPHFERIADRFFSAEVDAVIVAGLTGALRPEHRRGEILTAREVQRDGGGNAWRCDERLVTAAASSGAVVADRLLSVGRLIATAPQKRALAAGGASAVDMESATILEAAALRRIPSIAVRVVGDASDEDLPLDFDRLTRADGTIAAGALTAAIVVRPWRWPSIVHFAVAQRRALDRLAVFLDRFTVSLGRP
jgi:nucleoside phosphorylase